MLIGYLDILLGQATTYACSTHFKLNGLFNEFVEVLYIFRM